MAVPSLICLTIISGIVCLWVRRITWSSRWELTATLMVAMQISGVVLIAPIGPGRWADAGLHYLLGRWNLEDYIGDLFILCSLACAVYTVFVRTLPDWFFAGVYLRLVVIPLCIAAPLMLALMLLSNTTNVAIDDFMLNPGDFDQIAYWIVFTALGAHLLTICIRALIVLRGDERSRWAADAWIVASTLGIAAAVAGFVNALVGTSETTKFLTWLFLCSAVITYAIAVGRSWHRKVRWFAPVSAAPSDEDRADCNG